MLLIESGDKATGQATYYTWDVKKHEFIEGEPFLTYEKEKMVGFGIAFSGNAKKPYVGLK